MPSMLFSGNLAVQEQSRQLFRCIFSAGRLTRPQILEQLNLPPTSLNRALDRLTEAGLIEVTGQAESTGGRPASLFQIRSDARLMLGISLEPSSPATIHLMMLDLSLRPVVQNRLILSSGNAAVEITAAAAELERAARLTIPPDSATSDGAKNDGSPYLIGIGIDGFGLLTEADQAALQTALTAHFSCPVLYADGLTGAPFLLGNTSNQQEGSFALLSLDDPIQLVNGFSHAVPANTPATSIGAYPLPDHLEDKDQPLRPLRDLLSPTALGRRFALSHNRPELDFADFCLALKQQKKKAVRLLKASASELALAVVGISCVTGLNNIMVSGELFDTMAELFPQTADKAAELKKDFGIIFRLERQPYGSDLRAAGIAAMVLATEMDS
ncbi:MAG: winged helix-turn-helix transcriptional regulator [Saccharofermentanales bacterium]